MKLKLFLLLLLNVAFSADLKSQSEPADFAFALNLYAEHDYAGALAIFEQIDSPESTLFQSKTHYALGNYEHAIRLVQNLPASTSVLILEEAQFTQALAAYQQKNFSASLDLLHVLSLQATHQELQALAARYFEQITSYLSFNQRLQVVRNSRIAQVREVVVLPFMSRYDTVQLSTLVNALQRANRNVDYGRYLNEIQIVAESVPNQDFGVAPVGTIYSIGVLLPGFADSPSDKPVTRGLYNGLLLAADAFNRQHPHQKVYLTFADTESMTVEDAFTRLIDEHQVDMVLGPLYSQEFTQLTELAERRGKALFAPLANTITIPREARYLFQVNPSFESRGRKTARYAMEELGLRRFAVMAEAGTNGAVEAQSFRNEIEQMGGEVVHYFVENYASRGYSVADYLPWFANDASLIDTTRYTADSLDAVYLPFTGEAAGILLDLVLTGIEAFNPDYYILGNEELGYIEHSLFRIGRLKMVYGDTYYLSEGDENVINFQYDYENRSGVSPNTFSYIGYDIGTYYMELLRKFVNPDNIPDGIEYVEPFFGLSSSIFFGEEQVNQALQYFRLTPTGPQPYQPTGN